MFKTFVNAWKVPEMKKKLLFTLLIVVLYRIGAVIHVPFTDFEAMQANLSLAGGNIFTYLNILSGEAFAQATLFALGVSPYITSSIVILLYRFHFEFLPKYDLHYPYYCNNLHQ